MDPVQERTRRLIESQWSPPPTDESAETKRRREVGASFEDRDFTSHRIFFVKDTTFVELVAPPEAGEPELTSRYTKTGGEPWMTHEVKRGNPPFPADAVMSAALDNLMNAMVALNEAWLES